MACLRDGMDLRGYRTAQFCKTGCGIPVLAKLRTVFFLQPFAGAIYAAEHSRNLILFNHGRHLRRYEAPCASNVPSPASEALRLHVPSIIPTVTHCFVKKQAQ